jgi:hypothetical protein
MAKKSPPAKSDGQDSPYEFRFLSNGQAWAIHTTSLRNDAEACERARQYLAAIDTCDCVVVRNGVRFMQKITNHGDEERLPPARLM